MRDLRLMRSPNCAALCLLFAVPFACAQYRGPDPAATQARAAADPSFYLPVEPAPNLGLLKVRLRDYADCAAGSACYARDLDAQTTRAVELLEAAVAHGKPGERLALVLDIDETSLSNLAPMESDDFGDVARDCNASATSANAPAIPGTLRLFNRAQALGVAVFFITGRNDAQRAATVANLTSAGYRNWQALYMQPDHPAASNDPVQTVARYKAAQRRKIVAAGYRIVLNVGDQFSDLDGDPHAEFSVKLPNPFYYLP